MSVKNFIPTLWSDMIFRSYTKNFVMASLANRSYEGEIRNFGDRVKISEIGSMTPLAYTGATITYSEPIDASKYLVIDQKYYLAQVLDDVDDAQTKPKLLNEIAFKMGEGFSDNVDQALTAQYANYGSLVSGTSSSPTSITSATITSLLSDAGVALSDNNVPRSGRVAVLPPWMVAKIGLARIIRDTNNSLFINTGYVGEFMGFSIFESVNVAHSSTTWYAPMFFRAGDTIAFAEQLSKMRALEDKDTFGNYLSGLVVYGSKVIRPESLAIAYVAKGSETVI